MSPHQGRFKGVSLMFEDAMILGVLISDTEGRCVDSVFEAADSASGFIDNKQTSVRLSVGLSVNPGNDETLEALLTNNR